MQSLTAIAALSERLAALQGRKRRAVAFALGICATAALPPLFLLPLAIPAYAGLLMLLAGAGTRRQAFFDGWWWGLGYYITGLYWMCIALLTDPWKFGWLIPFALIGLNGLIALFPALASALTWRRKASWITQGVELACWWTLVEFARGHVLTGFPWNLPGYTFSFSDALLQSASVIGAYGLSFVVVLAAVAPAVARSGRGVVYVLAVWGIVGGMAVAGQQRLAAAPPVLGGENSVPGVKLRIVQGNISQHHKWNPRLQMQGLQSYLDLTRKSGFEQVTHVIWPETAVPFVLNENPSLLNLLALAAPADGAFLAGTLRSNGETDNWQIWNSLASITRDGKVTYYDKHHLVPFGEFVPLRGILPIDKITPGAVDFSRGPGVTSMKIPGAIPPASPLICYEAIFPGAVADRDHRPGWMLNVTNDAWFGSSSGPYQHFESTRMRAAEEGLPLVRAANTGISAIIDAYGRVVQSLPLNAEGVIDGTLPPPTKKPTIYSSGGDKYLLLLIILLLIPCNFNKQFKPLNKSRLH